MEFNVGDTAVIKEDEGGWAKEYTEQKVRIEEEVDGCGNYRVRVENGEIYVCSETRLREPTMRDGSFEGDRIEPGDKVICTEAGWGLLSNCVGKGFIALNIDDDTLFTEIEDRNIAVIPLGENKKHAVKENACLRKATEVEKRTMTFHGEEQLEEDSEDIIAEEGDTVRVIPDYDGEDSHGMTQECYKWSNLMTPLTLIKDWKGGDDKIHVKDKGGEVRGSDRRWYLPSDILTTTEPSNEEYERKQGECNLKIGDKVKITRSAERHERGWNNGWVEAAYAGQSESMDQFIDEVVTISRFKGNKGIGIKESDKSFPFFVMEKVEESKTLEKSEDELYPEKEEMHDRQGYEEGDLVYVVSAGYGDLEEWKCNNVLLEIVDFYGFEGNPRVKPKGEDREPLSIHAKHLSPAEDLEFGSSDRFTRKNPCREVSISEYDHAPDMRSKKKEEKKLLL